MKPYVAAMVRHGRWRLVTAVILTVLNGVTESAAVVFLVPVLDVIGLDVAGGLMGRVSSGVRDALDAVGLGTGIAPVLGLYVVVGCLLALLRRYASVNAAELQYDFSATLRRRLYEALACSSWFFVSRQRSADLTHVLTTEVDRVGLGAQQLVILMGTMIGTAMTLALAVALSPTATGAAVVGGGALLLVTRRRAQASLHAGREMSRTGRLLYQTTMDHLAGMKTAKSHGAEAASVARFDETALDVSRSQIHSVRHLAALRFWFDVGVVVVAAGVLAVAVEMAHMSPAETILLLFVFVRVAPRLSSIQQTWARVITTVPAYATVAEWQARCDAAREDLVAEEDVGALREALRVEGVTFSYAGPAGRAAIPALCDVDLTLPAGSMTALVGPSGSGKSTLVDMVVGLLRPDSGRVTVDGVPLEGGRAQGWRRRVGYVGQDPFMLHDTVRANLLAARPDASDADLQGALGLASADGFVAALPEGIDTVVGDRGSLISGGERQRLALARALLRGPSLLVLDEASSNLDPANEARILDTLDSLRGKVTILLVAHRPGTAARADAIHTMVAGRLVPPAHAASLEPDRSS